MKHNCPATLTRPRGGGGRGRLHPILLTALTLSVSTLIVGAGAESNASEDVNATLFVGRKHTHDFEKVSFLLLRSL